MRAETGWLVFFYPRRGKIASWVIALGEMLGAVMRGHKVPLRTPCHVEIVRRAEEGVRLYGATANTGFVGKPAWRRLAGLKAGTEFCVVSLPTTAWEAEINTAIVQMDGTPYEEWGSVLKVWRDGNRTKGAVRVFCSEAVVRILEQTEWAWVMRLDPDNTDPLELQIEAYEHHGVDVTKEVEFA